MMNNNKGPYGIRRDMATYQGASQQDNWEKRVWTENENTHPVERISLNNKELERLEAIPIYSRTYQERLQLQYLRNHVAEQRTHERNPELKRTYDVNMRILALTEKNSHQRFEDQQQEAIQREAYEKKLRELQDKKRKKFTAEDMAEEFDDIEEQRNEAQMYASRIASNHAIRQSTRLVSSFDKYGR